MFQITTVGWGIACFRIYQWKQAALMPVAYHAATRFLQKRVLLQNREKRDSIQSTPDGFDYALVTVIPLNSG